MFRALRYTIPLLLTLWRAGAEAQESTWTAAFTDGSRVTQGRLSDWHDVAAQPKINERLLLDAANHVRWLREESIRPPTVAGGFVEMHNLDRLPGKITRYNLGSTDSTNRLLPALLIAPALGWDFPDGPTRSELQIAPTWVRRIVLQPRSKDVYRPSTALLRDGRELRYRALRWATSSVVLLLDDGTRELAFDELAELHMPVSNPWDSYFRAVAALNPDLKSSLTRIETSDGFRAITSTNYLHVRHYGDPGKPNSWYHAIQPPWCYDVLWIPQSRVSTRRYWQSHEVPFPLTEPEQMVRRASLSGSWSWKLDRDTQGGTLHSAGLDFGWGIGSHAYQELHFSIPSCATTFQTRVGLDNLVGQGGCAQGLLYANSTSGELLYKTPLLIGSKESFDSGRLELSNRAAPIKQLVLVADPVHKEYPPGSDPLDIRDAVNFLEPQLTLDTNELLREVHRRAQAIVPAWDGWTLSTPSTDQLLVRNAWDGNEPHRQFFRTEVRPSGAFFTLKRQVVVARKSSWLVVLASRHQEDAQASPSRIQVRINGLARWELEVPKWQWYGDPQPLAVSLDEFAGQSVSIEIVQMAENERSWVRWRRIGIEEDLPGLIEVLSDGREDLAESLDDNHKFSGSTSIRLTDGQPLRLPLPREIPIRGAPQLGQYRVLRFAWKKKSGVTIHVEVARGGAQQQDANAKSPKRLIYHCGNKPQDEDIRAHAIGDQNQEAWQMITRDMRNDLGEDFSTAEIILTALGGDALADHVFLARGDDDLRHAPLTLYDQHPKPAGLAAAQILDHAPTAAEYGRLLTGFAPAFSTSSVGDSGVFSLQEYAGRKDVLSTHHRDDGQPAVLRAPIDVPPGRSTKLILEVTHQREPAGEWQLVVMAAGQTLHDSIVNATTTKDGWQEIAVDLTQFAGRGIVIEVQNRPRSGRAFWRNIRLTSL